MVILSDKKRIGKDVMENDFLLEIGTEEMPFSFLQQAIQNLEENARQLLKENRLHFKTLKAMGTPRRLALLVSGLQQVQEDLVQEISGPPRSVAFDDSGAPTKALEKLCARYGVSPQDVSIIQKDKGEYVGLKSVEQGKKAIDLLPEILPPWILSFSFPKSMRWGALDIRFMRPIRWLAALYGQRVVSFELGDMSSSAYTYGHRFFRNNAPVEIKGVSEYQALLKDNKVILDPEERRQIILDQARGLADEVGGTILEEQDLIQNLISITEYPVAIRGEFEEKYLELPEEVLVATMKGHQKYFALRGNNSTKLLPYFVAVANLDAPDMGLIKRGNEKVLRARLEDAKFFFEEDTKIPLENNVAGLKQVIFHKKLGTSFDKVQRVQSLAVFLAENICPEAAGHIERAARLCKADLVTEMVGEFPELQGIMGGIYAAHSGETATVSKAIQEHYMPVSAEGDMPSSLEGSLLSLADKMDTIVGFFGIGTSVSGTSDPFGLRRRTIGSLRLLLDKGLEFSLPLLVKKAAVLMDDRIQEEKIEQVVEAVVDFFRQRYHQFLLARGFPHDTIDAVLSREFENIPDLYKRLEALHGMRTDPDFEKLILGCKRTVRILEQAEKDLGYHGPQSSSSALGPDSFELEAEKNLYAAMNQVKDKIAGAMEAKEYQRVLQHLVTIKNPIDLFFDDVMVMVDDEFVRARRLELLFEIAGLFRGFADFSKILL